MVFVFVQYVPTKLEHMQKTVKTNLFLFSFLMTQVLALSNDATLQYIEKYKTIAISEMQRTGIPASIKLAQGILESNSGQSTLARQSNNHFGIKCGDDWDGEVVYRHDDDYHNGLLVKSCFRSYDDPYESYIAHSDFLSNPYSRRYKFLFNLEQTDYRAWAHGLKKSGYATDQKYPEKLIRIIENYQLYQFDEEAIYYGPPTDPLVSIPVDREEDASHEKSTPRRNTPDTRTSRRSIRSSIHLVKRGENMSEIASLHRMDPRTLYFQNRLPYGATPAVGETLVTDRYLQFKKRPKIETKDRSRSSFLFEETIVISSE